MKKFLIISSVLLMDIYVIAQDDTIKDLKKSSELAVKKDPADTIPKIWRGFYGKLKPGFPQQLACRRGKIFFLTKLLSELLCFL